MFDIDTASRRWARVRAMMERLDLDLLLAIDVSRDEILLGQQRWLTGYIAIGGPAAALIRRDGGIELVSERIGKPVARHYAEGGFPIELVNGFSSELLAERIARHAPRRLGFAEPETMTYPLFAALQAGALPPELVDASATMLALRMVKDPYEIDLIRRSSAIADVVWGEVGSLFKIGRRNYELVADIDHLVRLHGAESGFHIVFRLPFLGRPMRSTANPERIGAGERYLIESAPRREGDYAQLTLPATTRANDEAALAAYTDVVAAKEAAQPRMRPGTALAEVGRFVADFLAARGRRMTSPSLGHFCGMALEEPRHDPASPIVLEENMTLIFHPVLADPELNSLMRADTYLIGPDGAERLTRYPGGLLTAA